MLRPFRAFMYPLANPENDLLPSDPPLVIPGANVPPPQRGNVVCEFCECSLTPHGDALRLSDKAKEYRGQVDTIDKLRAQVAELGEKVAQLERHNRELNADLDAQRRANLRSDSPFSR